MTPSKLFPALKMSPFHPAGLTPVSSVTPQTDRGRRPLRNNMQVNQLQAWQKSELMSQILCFRLKNNISSTRGRIY